MKIEAVLFDLFDTLLIIDGGEAFYAPSMKRLHESLTKDGVSTSFGDFSRVYFEVRDQLYAEASESLAEPHFNVRVAETLRRFGCDFSASDLIVTRATEAFSKEFMRYICLDKDAPDVLKKLYGKYKLGIVSNFAIPECIWKLLEKFDLRDFFDVVVISSEVNKRKPSSEIFEKALTALRVDASRAIFVGDTPNQDINGAKNTGMTAILVERKRSATATNGSFVWKSPQANVDFKPDMIIESLDQLLTVLGELRIER